MKIDGTAPTQGPEGRRFQAAKSNPAKEGGKSFGALLKKAVDGAPEHVPAPPAPASGSAQASIGSPGASAVSAPARASSADAASEAHADSGSKAAKKRGESGPGDFANHMEMVKLRLKSGYYNNSNVDDALSEKLTGFFDDLA